MSSPTVQYLEEAGFLHPRNLEKMGRNFMRRTMRHSTIFSGSARKALRNRATVGHAKAAVKNPLIFGGLNAKGKRDIDAALHINDAHFARMRRSGKKLAPVIGGVMLGAAAASRAYRFAKKVRKMQQPTQYRSYDVYPEYGYATVGIQPYNQPYYNDPNRSGPPRHQDARVGVYEREQIIDRIVEAVSKR